MKFRGRDSEIWHKNINDTVGPRRPTDSDFPWNALQDHTRDYMKRKGKLSQIQVDAHLVALIQNHPSKEVAIAACADRISARIVKNLLVNDFKVEPDGALGIQEYLQGIVATVHVNPGAVSEIEAQRAKCLLEHAAAGGSSRTLAQQLYDVLSLLPVRVAPDLLLRADIQRLAESVCTEFAKQLQDLRGTNQWTEAHVAIGWLSPASTGSNTLQTMHAETRVFLDNHLPNWEAWAAWRPSIPRLRAWKWFATCTLSSLKDLLALEGPDFASVIGSEQATLRKGLIAQGSRGSQSTLQWGRTHASFRRNPFREFENVNGILERLTSVMDFACSAGPEYTALLAHPCEVKAISNEVLQILEGVQILGEPTFTTVVLRAFTDPKQNVGEEIWGIRQLLPALSDDRISGLRQQMQPYFVDRISGHVRELHKTLLMQFGAGSDWLDAATELLVFTHELQEESWLLAELDPSVQQHITSAPSLITIETLSAICNSVRSATTPTPVPLLSQIDAYCKAQFIPSCTVDPQGHGLVETLISLWQQDLNRNYRGLALLVADLPNTGCQFRRDCLTDIMTLTEFWVTSALEALKLQDTNPDLGCIALIRLLASESRPDIRERWRKVLTFAIEKQHETLLQYAVTHLTTNMWLELLSNIRMVYEGCEVITERHSPRLLSLELHTWAQQMADHLPTLTRLESVLRHGPAMQVLLLGTAASKSYQLLRVLGLVKDSKSSSHADFMNHVIGRLRSGNSVFEAACTLHPEVYLAIQLRAGDFSEPDRLALRRVARLYGTNLDAEGYPSAACLKEAINRVDERYVELMTKAQRLENLRLSLQAVAPKSVLTLLGRLHIEAPSIVDNALAILPSSLGSLVERISRNELELQFPATELTRMQRFAIGAGDSESFLIRLTLRDDGAPIKFCVHLSAESSDETNSKTFSHEKGHTPWGVFRSYRPPQEQYCRGRPNLGTYQLSRILWHHLHPNFRSLEQTHAYMTSKMSKLGQGCAVCGLG